MSYIYIINGPNLNMLGQRESALYGTTSFSELEQECFSYAKAKGYNLKFLQSNIEGELVNYVQQACQDGLAIIINAAAYSHSSIALLDALYIFKNLVIEVHISNIYARENFRHHSYISRRAQGVISGLGCESYMYALEYIDKYLKNKL